MITTRDIAKAILNGAMVTVVKRIADPAEQFAFISEMETTIGAILHKELDAQALQVMDNGAEELIVDIENHFREEHAEYNKGYSE